jgi:MFS transporter, putative metabolite:H+ symporter
VNPQSRRESLAGQAAGGPLTSQMIGRAIDLSPLTRRLAILIAVAAAGYLFDSFDIGVMSYALPSVAREFQLRPAEVGIVGSAGLAGMVIGSMAWGWIADRWGRAVVFAGTVLMFSFFTCIAAVAYSAGFFIGVRFLTGIGLGGTIPIDSALVAEYAPARLRGRISALLPVCWPIGIFAAAGAGLLLVPTLGWRWLFVIGALPAVLVFFIRRGIPESPRWLAAKGRPDRALESLRYVGVTDDALGRARSEQQVQTIPLAGKAGLGELFSGAYARRVVHTWSLWFFSSLSYWAFVVWLPTVYATVYHIQLTRTLIYTFIVAGASVVGRSVAFVLVDRIGRKPVIVWASILAGVTICFFNLATTDATLVIVAVLYAFFGDQASVGMTVYTPEVYPLRIRGLGTSWAMALGRLAGAISPFLVGLLLASRNISLVWWAMGACQLIAGLMTAWLAVETRGRNLERVSEAA